MKRCEKVLKQVFAVVLTVILLGTTVDLSGLTVFAQENEMVETVTGNTPVYEENSETAIVVEETEEQRYVSNVDIPDNEELFAGYVDKTFYGEDSTFGGISTLGVAAGEQLSTMPAKALYDYLKNQITAVANGSQASTRYVFDASALGAKSSFTATDLGVDALIVNNSIPQEVVDAAFGAFFSQFEMATLNDALLHDCPYELYW